MAKRRSRGGSIVVVRGAAPVARGGYAIARAAGRGALAAARWAAREEEHRLWAIGAALGLGAARRYGVRIPRPIEGVSPALQYGLIAWGIGRLTKSRIAEHLATGLLAVGAYEAVAFTSRTREEIERLMEEQAADTTTGAVSDVRNVDIVGEVR